MRSFFERSIQPGLLLYAIVVFVLMLSHPASADATHTQVLWLLVRVIGSTAVIFWLLLASLCTYNWRTAPERERRYELEREFWRERDIIYDEYG